MTLEDFYRLLETTPRQWTIKRDPRGVFSGIRLTEEHNRQQQCPLTAVANLSSPTFIPIADSYAASAHLHLNPKDSTTIKVSADFSISKPEEKPWLEFFSWSQEARKRLLAACGLTEGSPA